MWNEAVFLVSCIAITVEHSVVSTLYMYYTAAMSYTYIATTSEDISILACEDEAHLAAFTE